MYYVYTFMENIASLISQALILADALFFFSLDAIAPTNWRQQEFILEVKSAFRVKSQRT